MNIEEMLQTRLEYCLMKQKNNKYRSSYYNYKVKQYKFLLSLYNKGDYDNEWQIAEMAVEHFQECYAREFNNSQCPNGIKPESVEVLENLERTIQESKVKAKGLKFLMDLEKFYEASFYDLVLAMKWDRFCQFGRI